MRETCGLGSRTTTTRDPGDPDKPSGIIDEIAGDSDAETTMAIGKQGDILDECIAEIAAHMMDKGLDVRLCVYLYMCACMFVKLHVNLN